MTKEELVAAMIALLRELLLYKLAGDDEALDDGMERLDALYRNGLSFRRANH
jgi:hypothetical protein